MPRRLQILEHEILNRTEFRKFVERLPHETKVAIREETLWLADQTVKAISRAAPKGIHKKVNAQGTLVPDPAPVLRKSFSTDARALGKNVTIRVFTSAPHYRYVVGGRGAVVPTGAKALAIVAVKSNPRAVFRTRAEAQGRNDFLERGLRANAGNERQALNRIGRDIDAVWSNR